MSKHALIVIDMLKEFVYGRLRSEAATNIVPNLKRLVERAREVKVPVIYCNDAHVPKIDRELKLWGEHAIAGAESSQVIDELKPREGDFVINKRRYSGFFETDLDLLLRELEASALILTGIHTHICVQHTAADAFFRGYEIIVVEDCTAASTAEDHRRALNYIRQIYGANVMSCSEVVELLERHR